MIISTAVAVDNGGRRTGIDRRYFSYSDHIPERRCGNERRCPEDRRSGMDRRTGAAIIIDLDERRNRKDRRKYLN